MNHGKEDVIEKKRTWEGANKIRKAGRYKEEETKEVGENKMKKETTPRPMTKL